MERQTPEIRKQLRELVGDDLDRFTVGSAWNSKNPRTGLPEFADANSDDQQTQLGPSGDLGPSAAGQPQGEQDPWSGIFENVISGVSPTGGGAGKESAGPGGAALALAPGGGAGDTGGPGNPAGGQPGSAGTGPGKAAADALFGLGAGALAPGFGVALSAAKALTDPSSFNPASLVPGAELLGLTSPQSNTPQAVIDNMSINPSAYGLDTGPGGADATGGTSGTAGGEHGAEKGAATGTDSSGLGPGGGADAGATGDHGSTGDGTGAAGGET